MAFDVWAARHLMSDAVTRLTHVSVYLIGFNGPFVLFVVGVDPARWEPTYVRP